MWKKLMKKRWYWGTDIISWSRLFWMHSTWMQTKRYNHWTIQKDVWITYFCWSNRKIAREPRSKVSAWSWDMEGHARKCMERFCELANKKTGQLHKASSPCLDDHQMKKEELENTVNCHKFAHILSVNACTWQELVDQTFCGQSINWPDLSRNGHNLVTDDWHDEFPTFITQVITANIVMWVMRRNIVDQGSSKTPILQDILETPNQHSYRSVGCARSEPQYLTALQNLKSFRLDAGLRMEGLPTLELWDQAKRLKNSPSQSKHARGKPVLPPKTHPRLVKCQVSSVKCKCWSVKHWSGSFERTSCWKEITVVHLRRQRSCDKDDHQGMKSHDEACVMNSQSCIRLVVRQN